MHSIIEREKLNDNEKMLTNNLKKIKFEEGYLKNNSIKIIHSSSRSVTHPILGREILQRALPGVKKN